MPRRGQGAPPGPCTPWRRSGGGPIRVEPGIRAAGRKRRHSPGATTPRSPPRMRRSDSCAASQSAASRAPPAGGGGFAWLGFYQLVADAPDCLDAGGTIAQLLAQPRHVDVDRTRIAIVVIAPGQLEQPLAIEDHAR